MNWLYAGNQYLPITVGYSVYNAYYYVTAAGWNTNRWELIYNSPDVQPQPGDIYVYNRYRWSGDETGHIGVYLSGSKSYAEVIDQDGSTVKYNPFPKVTYEGRGVCGTVYGKH